MFDGMGFHISWTKLMHDKHITYEQWRTMLTATTIARHIERGYEMSNQLKSQLPVVCDALDELTALVVTLRLQGLISAAQTETITAQVLAIEKEGAGSEPNR